LASKSHYSSTNEDKEEEIYDNVLEDDEDEADKNGINEFINVLNVREKG
jgi:hypothetical protein